jgi:hypothetical protein
MTPKIDFGPQFTMKTLGGNSDEVIHTFHIDWLREPEDIAFEATFYDVMSALDYIKQTLCDWNCGRGIATVATFFRYINRTDIIEKYPKIKEVGWNVDILDECDISFLQTWIIKRDGSRNEYNIYVGYYPEDTVWDGYSETMYDEFYQNDGVVLM